MKYSHQRGVFEEPSSSSSSIQLRLISLRHLRTGKYYFCFAVNWIPIDRHTNFVAIHLSGKSCDAARFTHWSHTVIFLLRAKSKQQTKTQKNHNSSADDNSHTTKKMNDMECIWCRLSKRATREKKLNLKIIEQNKQNH